MTDSNTFTAALPALNRPVAIFDAGIGSYAAVAAIQRRLPQQDIVYFADRASFPYGSKNRAELLAILRRTLRFLDRFAPTAVLVASNAPSITVLDELTGIIAAPVFGVRPPIKAALQAAKQAGNQGDVAVLGVQSMVQSPELRAYAAAEAEAQAARVHLVNASALVDLVESGAFLYASEHTAAVVSGFLDDLDQRYPRLAALTLSSTHLPWLRDYFVQARSSYPLLDPLADAIGAIVPHAVQGTGSILALVTEDERYSAGDFQQMLKRLGINLALHVVRPESLLPV